MNTEEFLDLFNQALKRAELDDLKTPGWPTLQEVEEAARWFMALHDAEFNHENNKLKDWAEIFRDGLVGTKNMGIQEWLDSESEYWEDVEETFAQYVMRRMNDWGWK